MLITLTCDAPRHPLLDFLTASLSGSTMLGFEFRISNNLGTVTDHKFSTD